MINCTKHAKVYRMIRVISLVIVLWEIMFAHMIKDVTHAFRVIKFMFVMCGAYDVTCSRQRAQAGAADTPLLIPLQDLAELMGNLEGASSMSSDTSEAQTNGVNVEDPENDINQQFIGARRCAWIHSVALESVKSSNDILNASDEKVSNLQAFLTQLNSHIGFNNEAIVLEELPCEQFKIKHRELHYLNLAHDKSELQVEKFMNHHCHGGDMGVVVYLMRSGYWVTQTHIDFSNVKEVYKQLQALKYQPYRPRIIEDNRHGGSSSSSSPMSERD